MSFLCKNWKLTCNIYPFQMHEIWTKDGNFMERVSGILKEKCPVCGKGDVFRSKGNPILLKVPQMNEYCPQCQHRFETEPGYFTGAMYISYGLNVLELIVLFVVGLTVGVSLDYIMYVLMGLVLCFWTFNFRKARIIWMYLF